MTCQEFFALIDLGYRCICETPEECFQVLQFLEEFGYVVSDCSRYHLDPNSPDYSNRTCLCPGIDHRYGYSDKHIASYLNSRSHGWDKENGVILFQEIPFDEQPHRWWHDTDVNGFLDMVLS